MTSNHKENLEIGRLIGWYLTAFADTRCVASSGASGATGLPASVRGPVLKLNSEVKVGGWDVRQLALASAVRTSRGFPR